jgi:hypothetical protein
MQNQTRYYKLYINKINTYLPMNFLGIIKVLNESDDNLINIWIQRELGDMYESYNKKLIKKWEYKLIDNINDLENKIIKTLKRY